MEVHAHTHTERKRLKHYFFEFFMLFLAVFAGFLAENQREHIVEKKREKDYIISLIEDLRIDTSEFASMNDLRRQAVDMYDSVILLLKKNNRTNFELHRLYYLSRTSVRISGFPQINDRTYEQMKSSGNLRLIHNRAIADKITTYYYYGKEFQINSQQTLLRLQSLLDYQGKVFDASVFSGMIDRKKFWMNQPQGNIRLITEDPEVLNELAIRVHYVLSILLYSENSTLDFVEQAKSLIQDLKKEYHLQ
jgi:hypothetical protein